MIYLDHAAATPLDPGVFKKMRPYFDEKYGNASSIHGAGRDVRAAIEEARTLIAKHLGATPKTVIFTSGGTEANNWAVFGLAEANRKRGNHIITSAIEHESVLEPCRQLEKKGFKVTYLMPDPQGFIRPEDLEKAITPETVFASIIYANNEIGTIQDIPAMAKIVHKKGIVFHTDACQATAYLPLNVEDLGVDAMTLNSGKIYGPKGVGALYVKEKMEIVPLFFGGGQEFRMRAGTENVAGIVGFAEALTLALEQQQDAGARLTTLRNTFIDELLQINGVTLNGDRSARLPNNVNIVIAGVNAESVLVRLDMEGVAASAGSACSSGSLEPSHVLKALGLSDQSTKSSIRFSLGRMTTAKELHQVAEILQKIIMDLRAL